MFVHVPALLLLTIGPTSTKLGTYYISVSWRINTCGGTKHFQQKKIENSQNFSKLWKMPKISRIFYIILEDLKNVLNILEIIF